MSDYAALAASVAATLARKGQAITRRATSVGAYDPATSQAATTHADTTRQAVALDFGAGTQTVRGNSVQTKDKRLLLDAAGPAELTDQYLVNGLWYAVVSIGETNPAGVPVFFDLHIRHG